MEYENKQIFMDSLPTLDDVSMEALDKKYLKVKLYSIILFFLFLIMTYAILGLFIEQLYNFPIFQIVLLGWALVFAISIWITNKSYYFQGFALRQKDIIYQAGWLFRSTMVIPFNRIQHCEINQGPIDRYFGLSALSVFTAGGSGSDLTIPGLDQKKAAFLKQYITNQVGADEEE